MKFKITNTTTVKDWTTNEQKIRLYGRDKDNRLQEATVYGIQPRFYAPTEAVREREDDLYAVKTVENIIHDPDKKGWKGEDLSRIECDNQWDAKEVAENFFDYDERYSADVNLTQLFRIQAGVYTGVRLPDCECHIDEVEPVEMKEPESRVSYIDIETDDRGEFDKNGNAEILSIVAEDSFDKETVGFFWTGGRDIEECFPNGRPENLDRLEVTGTEKGMLRTFRDFIQETDPDILTGWNFEDFDARFFIQRFENKELDSGELSREGYSKVTRSGTPIIKGRTVYDLQDAWKRTKFTEPKVKALGDVAEMELGKDKVEHTNMGYYQMWEEDPELLLNYNAVDVTLCRDLNNELEVFSFWGTLRDVVGVDWDATRSNSDYVEMMARRKLYEWEKVGPCTNYGRPDTDFDGAYVFDPSCGVLLNVMGIDLSSLYPNTMAMANLGSEAKVTFDPNGSFDSLEAKVEKLRNLGINVAEVPLEQTGDRAFFRLDKDAALPSITDDGISLKEDAKAELKTITPGTEEFEEKSEEYGTKKTVTNSTYGVGGWEPFFLFDPQGAEAVTQLGQECIKRTARFIEEQTECTIAYGDTDSNYVKFPDEYSHEKCVERTKEICKKLNEEVYPEFAETFGIPAEQNRWHIEPEALSETFFQSGNKKRYAHKDVWEEGTWMDEPSYDITGFGSERSDTSRLSEETEVRVLYAILDLKSDSEISKIVEDAADEIGGSSPDWERIKVPGGFGQPFDQYDMETAHLRGYRYWSELTGVEMQNSGKPGRVYLDNSDLYSEGEEVDVITFEDFENASEELESRFRVRAGKMMELTIKSPLRPILEAVGIDVEAAISGQQQQGLEAFC